MEGVAQLLTANLPNSSGESEDGVSAECKEFGRPALSIFQAAAYIIPQFIRPTALFFKHYEEGQQDLLEKDPNTANWGYG